MKEILGECHHDLEVQFMRTLPLDPGKVKELQHDHDERILDMSTVASQRDVTHELTRTQDVRCTQKVYN